MTQINTDQRLAPFAKRLVKQMANEWSDPESLVPQKDVANLSAEDTQWMFWYMREVSRCVRKAFETNDSYERDWLLFMARFNNGVARAGKHIGNIPGYIPMPRQSQNDRAIWIVQTRLAKHMAVCRRKLCKHRYFFRTRKGQQYCSDKCAYLVRVAGKLRWYHEVGSGQRRRMCLRK